MKTLNDMLSDLTAFDSIEQLEAKTANGYVPTILYRDADHIRLVHLLRQRGVRVWTGE